MKLIFCIECQDIISLWLNEKRYCKCKKSWGRYVTQLMSEISGPCIPIAMASNMLSLAVKYWQHDGRTCFINTWTIDATQMVNDVKIIVKKEDKNAVKKRLSDR